MEGTKKEDTAWVSIMFTRNEKLRINRKVKELNEALAEGCRISRHAFMKRAILSAVMEDY